MTCDLWRFNIDVSIAQILNDYSKVDEAFEYLSKYEDAEVALMHSPPLGFGNEKRHIGEYSLLAYLYRNQPSLILTGHTHEPSIIKDKKTDTYVINPGKLGEYNGDASGSFLEIDIDEEELFVKPIAHYVINGDLIKRRELKN